MSSPQPPENGSECDSESRNPFRADDEPRGGNIRIGSLVSYFDNLGTSSSSQEQTDSFSAATPNVRPAPAATRGSPPPCPSPSAGTASRRTASPLGPFSDTSPGQSPPPLPRRRIRSVSPVRVTSPSFIGGSSKQATTMQKDSKKLKDRLSSLREDVDARKFEFVEPFPKEVQTECSVCLCLLKEPYTVSCCGYRFCKLCIERVSTCPLCKQTFQKIPDKQLQRLLDQRSVYCLLKDDGCTWEGEMCKLVQHLQLPQAPRNNLLPLSALIGTSFETEASEPACKYVPYSCKACKVYLRRLDKVNHKVMCPMRKVKCQFCEDYTCRYNFLQDHYATCPNYKVDCPNDCGIVNLVRKDLEPHLDNECPQQEVKCEYHYAGCEASMIRWKMPKHMEENTKEHLSMVSTEYQRVNEEYETLKEHVQPMKDVKNIENIYISNLADETYEGMIHSRFGQFGTVQKIEMIPSCNAAIVKFSNQETYGKTLYSSYQYGINLLRHRLRVTPIFNSTAEHEKPDPKIYQEPTTYF